MKKILFDSIMAQVLERYQITKQDLYEQTKMPDVVNARYLLYYACNKNGISMSRIHKLLKEDGYNTTYQTVLRGIHAMEKRAKKDKDYLNIINSIQP